MKIRLDLLIAIACLTGCAAALVPTTDDPSKKIIQAYELLSVYRHIPARRLIDEAMQTYKSQGDIDGLTYAYTASTDYYRYVSSPAYKKYYENYSSNPATVTPISMWEVFGPPQSEPTKRANELAVDAYNQAIAKAIDSKDHFKASARYYRLFVHQARNEDSVQACKALDGASEQNRLGLAVKPDQRVSFDASKYKSFDDEIEAYRGMYKCTKSGK